MATHERELIQEDFDQQMNDNLKNIKKRVGNLEEEVAYGNDRLNSIIVRGRIQNILCVILVIAVAFAFLVQFNVIRSNKVALILYMVSDSNSELISDKTQVDYALKQGGSIYVLMTQEGYLNAFGGKFITYGAPDANKSVIMDGAAINYILSHGWSLIQAPSSLVNAYYFEKRVFSH